MLKFASIILQLILVLHITLSCSALVGQDDDNFFSTKIAPIFERKCVSCHNANDQKGELSLQSNAGLLAGGESGSVIKTDDPDASILIEYIVGDSPEMPLDSDPLSKVEIDLIKKWIAKGAKWPEQLVLKNASIADLNWWSLKPLAQIDLDKIKIASKSQQQNPIDILVESNHKDRGMRFAALADRRTLIRRLYFDLIGIPPSPSEIADFVQSVDPHAYEKLVDRLLASKHYGERWARHWLDVVQYGETHGYDKDKLRMQAWPYRDYVIRAFNEDKSYSRFVREQLAGDVLWPHTTDGTVATGFISAGPWDFIGHAEVPETKTDGKVARNLDRDNMVTSTMNTFCSLTVQCARCHDHKLDPVSMSEYYSLQAVFASIDRAERSFDADPKIAKKRFELLASRRSQKDKLSQLNRKLISCKTDEIKKLEIDIAGLKSQITGGTFPETALPRSGRYGYHSHVAKDQETVKWVQVDLGKPIPIEQVILFGADEYGFKDFGFPHRFAIECSNDAKFRSREVIADFRGNDFARPNAVPSIFSTTKTAQFVRVTATKLWSRRQNGQSLSNDWIFALGELSVVSNGRIANVSSVSSLDSIEAVPRWGKANLVDYVFGSHNLETKLGSKESPTNGFHSQFAKSADSVKWVTIELSEPSRFDAVEVLPAYPTDFAETPGFGFPNRYKIEASNQADFAAAKTILDATGSNVSNPRSSPVVAKLIGDEKYKYVRFTATSLWDRGESHFILALSEMNIIDSGNIISRNAKVTSSDSYNGGRWQEKFLVDGFTSRLDVSSAKTWFNKFAPSKAAQSQFAAMQVELEKLTEQAAGKKLLDQISECSSAINAIDSEIATLPPQARVYAGTVHRGSGNFVGRAGMGPREIRILHRGDVSRPGNLVSPGTVPFIQNVPSSFELQEKDSDGQRRLALANWITRNDNPLTWRSIVNRIWQYHFGKGLVDTPNDFGRGGSQPTHPQLLDWLATEFRDGGNHLKKQSIKSLHRLIVTSRAYQQASQSSDFVQLDQGNRYLWKMNRRRLDAEQIHDTVLAVTDLLNMKMGGPSYQDFVIERPEHSPHYEYHLHDPMDKSTHRRAIYRFIVRSQPQPFMDTLNCADPSSSVPKRSETLTALQALGMLNNRFMVAMSEQFAARLTRDANTIDSQIGLAYQLIAGRKPSVQETKLLVDYTKQHGLKNTCRVLFNLNEFVFVD